MIFVCHKQRGVLRREFNIVKCSLHLLALQNPKTQTGDNSHQLISFLCYLGLSASRSAHAHTKSICTKLIV